jgi:hypothetical protein
MLDNSEAYKNVATALLNQLSDRSPAVRTCLLHGSVARGRIKPGRSDLIDALVVVDDSFHISFEIFSSTLKEMAQSCRSLQNLACPTHPFQFYTRHEIETSYPGSLLAIWGQRDGTLLISGEDVRECFSTTEMSRRYSPSFALSFARSVQRLLAFLAEKDPNKCNRENILKALTRYRKTVPLLVCMSFGLWLEHSEAEVRFGSLVPGIDLTPFEDLRRLDNITHDLSLNQVHDLVERFVRCCLDLSEVAMAELSK